MLDIRYRPTAIGSLILRSFFFNMMKRFTFLLFILSAVQSISAQCDKTKIPVVFIHGFLASGDSYAAQVQRFGQAG